MLVFDLLLTVYFWTVTSIFSIFTYIICRIIYPFVSQKTFARTQESLCAYPILYSMIIPGFWKLTIKDYRKNKNWNCTRFVIIANHLSFIDSLLLATIPLTKKFMMGKIFSKIPLFGWLTTSSGYVLVDRNDSNTTYDAVQRATESMKDGCSFALFPEGRRSLDGKLDKFKTGAYRIAQQTKTPILPIVLKNTDKAMRFGGIASFANIEMIIGEPFNASMDIHSDIKFTKTFMKYHGCAKAFQKIVKSF